MDQTTLSPTVIKHKWAAGGVSSYPLTHPIVGQGRFYQTFRNFIHLVDQESEKFAHVFAVVAQWGIGKSRVGYELIAQINDSSRGWYVRDIGGDLIAADLFNDDADRDQYLGLYIRYSQVASENHNIDNWFGFGMYKALLPLAHSRFDDSIQGRIAQETYDRLLVKGFDAQELASAMEVENNYSDEQLYDDPHLVTNLCKAAYSYLNKFGINYILIVLDELETVAEAATYGLESDEIKHLDGRAIKLMGKAIKEEDPRRKLPFLRYVALCSPAIGDELREIKSTARRFELVDLDQNGFSDVSDFVKKLRDKGRLTEEYPVGLVEAAYAMSGGNFGWFNVIMANADAAISNLRLRRTNDQSAKRENREGALPTIVEIFKSAVDSSSRMSDYVLDYNIIDDIKVGDRQHYEAARALLYGQLPMALTEWDAHTRLALMKARNIYDEPVAVLYRRVEWDDQECSSALHKAKFVRDKQVWFLPGVDEPLELRQLLANLSTYSIHEASISSVPAGKRVLLVPIEQKEFIQLVSLLYPHPASEDAARALWSEFIGSDRMPEEAATHIGPSIAMLGRFNLRYRKQSHNSLIFRSPDENAAFEQALEEVRKKEPEKRPWQILTGAMRLIDNYWEYDRIDAGLKNAPPAIVTSPTRRGAQGGLYTADALKLHPDNRLLLAYVNSQDELSRLCQQASSQFAEKGRTPVIAFTRSRYLIDTVEKAGTELLKTAHGYLMLYQLSEGEEFNLYQIGIAKAHWHGFKLDSQIFSTAFTRRLNTLQRGLMSSVKGWRQQLNEAGHIAWPLKPGGRLREDESENLFRAWHALLIGDADELPSLPKPISALTESARVDIEQLSATLSKMGVSPNARSRSYDEAERAMLFSSTDDRAVPMFPPFLHNLVQWFLKHRDGEWTMDQARRQWFWGYIWEGSREQEIFDDWMALACHLGFVSKPEQKRTEKEYKLREHGYFRNAIKEAENWLDGEYPRIVGDMKAVFGQKKVEDYFDSPAGSKTKEARKKIIEANEYYQRLKAREDTLDSRMGKAEYTQALIESAWLRGKIMRKIAWVYDRDEYQQLTAEENVHTLHFEDDSEPLWKRIKRAELFVIFVRAAASRINERIAELSDEMHEETKALPGFPVNIFTRSFDKISNILKGALSREEPLSSTQGLQQTEPGTLGHYLSDLKIGEAKNKLAQLAGEVGIDIDTLRVKPLAEIEGSVAQGFRTLKKIYEQTKTQLEDYQRRIKKLEKALMDAPDDFLYPKDAPSIDELVITVDTIDETLQTLNADEVERLRSEFDAPAKLGIFAPLMRQVERLLEEPRNAIGRLAGHVQTVENNVTRYRERLLKDKELRAIEAGLNALLQAQGQATRNPILMADLENAGSLKAAVNLCESRRADWTHEGNELLAGTGVAFTQWQRIVADLEAGRNPRLDAATDEQLVARGLLVRTYKLGGQMR